MTPERWRDVSRIYGAVLPTMLLEDTQAKLVIAQRRDDRDSFAFRGSHPFVESNDSFRNDADIAAQRLGHHVEMPSGPFAFVDDSRFHGVKSPVHDLESPVHGLESRVHGRESRVDGIESRVDRIEPRVHFLLQLVHFHATSLPSSVLARRGFARKTRPRSARP